MFLKHVNRISVSLWIEKHVFGRLWIENAILFSRMQLAFYPGGLCPRFNLVRDNLACALFCIGSGILIAAN